VQSEVCYNRISAHLSCYKDFTGIAPWFKHLIYFTQKATRDREMIFLREEIQFLVL